LLRLGNGPARGRLVDARKARRLLAGSLSRYSTVVLGPWCLGLGPSLVPRPFRPQDPGPSTDQAPSPKHQGLPRSRFQQQILEVVAEVGVGRDGAHLCLIDRSVRIQREGDVGVGAELAIGPARDEGVVLPVLERAGERWRLREANRQPAVSLGDFYVAVPA